jgi:hypothetical protein
MGRKWDGEEVGWGEIRGRRGGREGGGEEGRWERCEGGEDGTRGRWRGGREGSYCLYQPFCNSC